MKEQTQNRLEAETEINSYKVDPTLIHVQRKAESGIRPDTLHHHTEIGDVQR